jgi:hypothetical protein
MEQGSPEIRSFLDEFVGETRGELFETREACVKFYSDDENFRRLQHGEIGDNLMYRYRAIASFHLWEHVCATAMEATRKLLAERGVPEKIANFDEFWADFTTYTRLRHASGYEASDIVADAHAMLGYDFPAWTAACAAGEFVDPNLFRLEEPEGFDFVYTAEGRREMRAALQTWTTQIKGLSKLVTRINVDWQVRRCVPAVQRILRATA